MNTTLIKTALGRSIMIQHDVSSLRPYSRIHLVSGTKGCAQKWPTPAKIALGHSWLKREEQAALEAQYTPEIVKRVGEMAKVIGGHGGMDFIMDWRLIDCLRNGLPLDQMYMTLPSGALSPLSANGRWQTGRHRLMYLTLHAGHGRPTFLLIPTSRQAEIQW